MIIVRLRAFWKRPANKLLVSLVALVVCSWLTYHALSALLPPRSAGGYAVDGNTRGQSSDRPRVVAVVKPNNTVEQREAPSRHLPLLAADGEKPGRYQQKKVVLNDVAREAEAKTARAEALVRADRVLEARKLVNEFLTKHPDHDACEPLRRLAVKLGEKTINSPKVYPGDDLCYYYTVQPGDTLSKIAKNCETPYGFIARINGIDDPRRLRAGQKIKLVKGPVNALVIKHRFTIYLRLGEVFFARFPVGLGKNDCTPEGLWIVDLCVKNPSYRDPETGKVYSPDDPENPTGGFWIALRGLTAETAGKSGYGLHGTNEPESIGKLMSKGCVRLRKDHAGQLFDMMLPKKSKVLIRP